MIITIRTYRRYVMKSIIFLSCESHELALENRNTREFNSNYY